MRELKEEMASVSRQEEEHKKRKTDAVSIFRLLFHFPRALNPLLLLVLVSILS